MLAHDAAKNSNFFVNLLMQLIKTNMKKKSRPLLHISPAACEAPSCVDQRRTDATTCPALIDTCNTTQTHAYDRTIRFVITNTLKSYSDCARHCYRQ